MSGTAKEMAAGFASEGTEAERHQGGPRIGDDGVEHGPTLSLEGLAERRFRQADLKLLGFGIDSGATCGPRPTRPSAVSVPEAPVPTLRLRREHHGFRF